MPKFKWLILTAMLLATPAFANTPHGISGVTDDSKMLSEADEATLNDLIAKFQADTGGDIWVVFQPDRDKAIDPNSQMSQSQYAEALGEKHGLFLQSGRNPTSERTAIFVVNTKEQWVWVELGRAYKLYYKPTDTLKILQDAVIPAYREAKMGVGTIEGVKSLISMVKTAPESAPVPPKKSYYPLIGAFAVLAIAGIGSLLQSTSKTWKAASS